MLDFKETRLTAAACNLPGFLYPLVPARRTPVAGRGGAANCLTGGVARAGPAQPARRRPAEQPHPQTASGRQTAKPLVHPLAAAAFRFPPRANVLGTRDRQDRLSIDPLSGPFANVGELMLTPRSTRWRTSTPGRRAQKGTVSCSCCSSTTLGTGKPERAAPQSTRARAPSSQVARVRRWSRRWCRRRRPQPAQPGQGDPVLNHSPSTEAPTGRRPAASGTSVRGQHGHEEGHRQLHQKQPDIRRSTC